MYRDGKVRAVVYSVGTADPGVSRAASDRLGRRYVAIRFDDLAAAFREGVRAFWKDVHADPARKARIDAAMKKWFALFPTDEAFQAMIEHEARKGTA